MVKGEENKYGVKKTFIKNKKLSLTADKRKKDARGEKKESYRWSPKFESPMNFF